MTVKQTCLWRASALSLLHVSVYRGVVRASITRLESRVANLQGKPELTAEDRLSVLQLLQRLNTLETDFKSHHFTVVDLLDDIESEQAILDETDDKVTNLTVYKGLCRVHLQPLRLSPQRWILADV